MGHHQRVAFAASPRRSEDRPRPFRSAAISAPSSPAERLRALKRYGIVEAPVEPHFDAIVNLAAVLCRMPMSAVTVLTEDRQWFKVRHGFEMTVTPIGNAFCIHALGHNSPFVVRDAATDPMFADNPLVSGPPGLRFYAGMPIHAPDGTSIGALCVFDTEPHPDGLDATERDALQTLARQVETQLQLYAMAQDLTAQIERQRRLALRLREAAEHDGLTGLLNRQAFLDRISGLSGCSSSALAFVDIDHFKQVNDGWGHDAGNAVLRHVADCLRSVARENCCARMGGDEFAILLSDQRAVGDPDSIVVRLLSAINRPVIVSGRTVGCSVSIGYSRGGPGLTCHDLMKRADLALCDAKRAGPGTARTFRPELERHFRAELAELQRARLVLAQDRLEPHYQPKLDLRSGELAGFEALLRWRDGDDKLGLPCDIAAAFQDHELASAIGRSIREKVLDDIVRWRADGIDVGHVGINTTAADFSTDDFAERLIESLEARAIPGRMIEVEVTETVVLGRGRPQIERALRLCRDADMGVALDDFGTGHAALTNLKSLPITSLKIDRAFVADVGNPSDDAIIAALATIGRRMGLVVIGEGVENADQVRRLIDMDVAQGQGFYFSRPLDADAVPAFVDSARARRAGPRRVLTTD